MLGVVRQAPPVSGTEATLEFSSGSLGARPGSRSSLPYRLAKRSFDLLGAVILMMPLALAVLALVVLNPWMNRGGLFFVQERMGQNGRAFRAWKFRTMSEAKTIERGAFDPLDSHRITPLGNLLRRSRLDELPQVLNVFRGEMSLIGPRPDYFPHAVVYCDTVPGYRRRHTVKPGISGYAQTEVGYVDGLEGVRAKVAADLYYVRHASLRFDLWITWRTLAVVLGRQGA